MKTKEITFGEVGIGQNFMVDERGGGDKFWCNKIDDARYICIGQNGAYFLPLDYKVIAEVA